MCCVGAVEALLCRTTDLQLGLPNSLCRCGAAVMSAAFPSAAHAMRGCPLPRSHWSKETGTKAEKLMGLEEVYEVGGSAA